GPPGRGPPSPPGGPPGPPGGRRAGAIPIAFDLLKINLPVEAEGKMKRRKKCRVRLGAMAERPRGSKTHPWLLTAAPSGLITGSVEFNHLDLLGVFKCRYRWAHSMSISSGVPRTGPHFLTRNCGRGYLYTAAA